MIKRKYFYNIKWLHKDGSQSYSYICGVITYKSLLCKTSCVYNHLKKDVEATFQAKFPDGAIEVVSFNRV